MAKHGRSRHRNVCPSVCRNVCPSARPFVTLWNCVKTGKHIIKAVVRAVHARPTKRYTQSRSTVNRVYDSKARRYAEDNRTESHCTHW